MLLIAGKTIHELIDERPHGPQIRSASCDHASRKTTGCTARKVIGRLPFNGGRCGYYGNACNGTPSQYAMHKPIKQRTIVFTLFVKVWIERSLSMYQSNAGMGRTISVFTFSKTERVYGKGDVHIRSFGRRIIRLCLDCCCGFENPAKGDPIGK
jgi:hypothetical protein